MPEKGRSAKPGGSGEDEAALYLEKKGLEIISRNFRSRGGEVDIIAQDEQTLVFIEVKAWSALGIEALEYGIDQKKQRRIIETAKYFLAVHRKYRYMAIRFDVIFITPQGINHLESAFMERV
ncbi:MAG: YraN family protein [Treponema sp.]|nr:YraN family protein [Treponema sp.]